MPYIARRYYLEHDLTKKPDLKALLLEAQHECGDGMQFTLGLFQDSACQHLATEANNSLSELKAAYAKLYEVKDDFERITSNSRDPRTDAAHSLFLVYARTLSFFLQDLRALVSAFFDLTFIKRVMPITLSGIPLISPDILLVNHVMH